MNRIKMKNLNKLIMRKLLILLFVTALFQVNAQEQTSNQNLSHLIKKLNQKSFKGQSVESDVLEIKAKRDSISILNQPQRLTTLMTDTSEVRLDSTLILNTYGNAKTKTFYNNIGQRTRVDEYNITQPNIFTYPQFCASGNDAEPTILTVNAEEIEENNVGTVILNNLSMIFVFDGNEYGCEYFEATLSVIGGVSNGVSITGCNQNMQGLDLTGFTSLTLTTSDSDDYVDDLEMCLTLGVSSYDTDTDPNEFIFISSTFYEYDDNGNQILYDYSTYLQDGSIDYRFKSETEYNDNNRILTIKNYDWDFEQESLYLNYDQERFYDENGYYVMGQLFFLDYEGDITYGAKYEFTRNDEGLTDYRTSYSWDNTAGFFLVIGEYQVTRFENFNTNILLDFNGSSSIGTSSPSYKRITLNDGNNTTETTYNWREDAPAYIPTVLYQTNRTYFSDEITLEHYEYEQKSWNAETNSFQPSQKSINDYDTEGNMIYYQRDYWWQDPVSLNYEFFTGYEQETQYDENGNQIFSKSSFYDGDFGSVYYIPGAWMSSSQVERTFEEEGFISQRLHSSGSAENPGDPEFVSPYFKDEYSTILDDETNFIRMGSPYLYENDNWQVLEGASYKSYYWYTQNSSLSSGENIGSRIGLYPNPTNSYLSINSEKKYLIEVFDLNGRKVMETNGNGIDISSLSNSTYIVKSTDIESKETISSKIIKD